MADYTVLVDDCNSQITYGPELDSWNPIASDLAYQGTSHNAVSRHANLTFSFVGGREIHVRGTFVARDNNASGDDVTYPVFQVDWQNFLNCTPNPPQNGGKFLCENMSLPSKITNHKLTMFGNPRATMQQFHIDFIHYGSSSEAAQAMEAAVLFAQSPGNDTQGLSFDSNWENLQSLGDANDIKSAMQTSTPSSKATYRFVGDSFAWWSCCMPPGASRNAANGTYSIDGGHVVSFTIGEQFIQGPACLDERILFQTQKGQLQAGNHTLEVVYRGDDTKMPLTLCALAATPLDFSALDIQPSSPIPPPPFSTPLPTATPSSTIAPSPSAAPSRSPLAGSNDHSGVSLSSIAIIAGIFGVAFIAFIILFVGIIWWRRKRAEQRAQGKRSSSTDSHLQFFFHPVVGFIDMDKRNSSVVPSSSSSAPSSSQPGSATAPRNMPAAPPVSHELDERNRPRNRESRSHSSPLEPRPPSYRTTGSLLDS